MHLLGQIPIRGAKNPYLVALGCGVTFRVKRKDGARHRPRRHLCCFFVNELILRVDDGFDRGLVRRLEPVVVADRQGNREIAGLSESALDGLAFRVDLDSV
jgi:hypothetical protein